MSDDLWVTIVGGLVVAVSVWILGVAHGQWKERSREGKDRRAITAALRMEIAANLTELEAVWCEIHRPPSVQEQTVAPHPEVDILPAVRLADRQRPHWKWDVWDTNLPRITAALDDADLARAERFYQGLAHFENRLRAIGTPWESAAGNLNLDDRAVQAWIELETIAEDLRGGGNPLSPRRD